MTNIPYFLPVVYIYDVYKYEYINERLWMIYTETEKLSFWQYFYNNDTVCTSHKYGSFLGPQQMCRKISPT